MFKNYLVIAFRHLGRHKLFSAINILCLAIGITFSMLIGVYIINQRNINTGFRNAGSQYVIKSNWKVKNMGLPITTVAPLAKTLKEKYPHLVAGYYRFNPVTNVVSAGDRHFKENISIGDTTLISVYGFKLLHGDPAHAFANNSSAVITENLALKLFGTTEAINKTISITNTTSDRQDYIVSAVLQTMPYNTVNNLVDPEGYSVFVPFEGNRFFRDGSQQESWDNIYVPGMIELQPGVTAEAVTKAAAELLQQHLPANLQGLLQPEFVPMKEYYLRDNNGAAQKIITTLSLVAGFILLMAVINFINISIGTSSYRLKEIGLRKVFGSVRTQLIVQHLTESLVLTLIAGLLSAGLYEAVRPVFDQVLNTQLDPVWQLGAFKTGLLLLLIISTGLIAGIYPAFILSRSGIVHAVKGRINTARGGLWLRKGLLVVQFSLAIFIFINALNISRQVSYVFNKNLGYDRDQLLVVTAFPKQWDSSGVLKMEAIKNGLLELPAVRTASLSFEVPDRTPPATLDLLPAGSSQPVVVPFIETDEDFATTFGLGMKEGRFMDNYDGSSADTRLVLNETAARSLGLGSGASGQMVKMPSGFSFTVAGVVKDFNYSSFQQSIGPLAFVHVKNANRYRYLTLKLHTADLTRTIAELREKWKALSPGSPFEYTFMDERFQALYQSELQLKKATQVATLLNLLIVFMGIFGVIAFTLARRTREIAMRKVLGAEVKNILFLFIKDYAWLIVIANIIAWPLAYITTDHWLQNYAYRMQQDLLPYLFVGGFMFLAAFTFITVQCLKTALSSPVKNLRAE